MTARVGYRRGLGWCVVIGLFGFAFAHLVVRGPIDHKGTVSLIDFANHWSAARLWLSGGNPYNVQAHYATWQSAGPAFEVDPHGWICVMAPGGVAAFAPFALLPPKAAVALWLMFSVACVALIVWSVLRLARFRPGSLLAWLFVAGALASAPIQALLMFGQASLPAIAFILTGLLLDRRGKHLLAGLLLGTAGALKPQLAGPFFLYYLLFRRWRTLGAGVGTVLALTLIAAAQMHWRGIDSIGAWTANVERSFEPGSANERLGQWRGQMIDMRVWFYALFDHPELVTAKAMIASMLLAAVYVVVIARMRYDQDPLLSVATLGALTMLPVYHRAYDAALLLPAYAWALRSLSSRRLRGIAIAALAIFSIFLIPWDAIQTVMRHTSALDRFAQSWAWNTLIIPHYAIATLGVALCMLWAFWTTRRSYERRPEDVVISTPAPVAEARGS